jgi:hypothetical protein
MDRDKIYWTMVSIDLIQTVHHKVNANISAIGYGLGDRMS